MNLMYVTKHSKELKLFGLDMSVDLTLLDTLMNSFSNSYSLHLNDKVYPLEDVSIMNSPTPVNSPTTRGGVYFSDKFAYKIKGTIKDPTVVPLLTKTMLGPNTEFGEIKITTQNNPNSKNIVIYANLTNSVQGKFGIQLNMIIVKLGFA